MERPRTGYTLEQIPSIGKRKLVKELSSMEWMCRVTFLIDPDHEYLLALRREARRRKVKVSEGDMKILRKIGPEIK